MRSLPICAHVTTAHRARDVRIFRKEARSLAAEGYEVVLIHPEGELPPEDGVRFIGLSLSGGRLMRFALGGYRAFRAARDAGATVFHFHDPDLIPWGMLWRALGGIAVYDVHEDVPKAVFRKVWIPIPAKRVVSAAVEAVEFLAARTLSAIVAATEAIGARFPEAKTIVVRNYADNIDDFSRAGRPYAARENVVLYAGTLGADRGLHRMLDAIQLVDPSLNARLVIAGNLRGARLVDSAGREPPPALVEFLGQVSLERVVELSGRARVGLHLPEPLPAYLESLPIKIFEFMAAGVPCVVSNFPGWVGIVERNGCGLSVDPLDPSAIAAAISELLRNPERAAAMGESGRQAVALKYLWATEAAELARLYGSLAGPPAQLG